MRNIINLAVAALAIVNMAYHLINARGTNGRLFGFEVNEYLYLAFWGLVAVSCLFAVYKSRKMYKKP